MLLEEFVHEDQARQPQAAVSLLFRSEVGQKSERLFFKVQKMIVMKWLIWKKITGIIGFSNLFELFLLGVLIWIFIYIYIFFFTKNLNCRGG